MDFYSFFLAIIVLTLVFLLIYYFPSKPDKKLNKKITEKLDEPGRKIFIWEKTTPFSTDKKILEMEEGQKFGAYGGRPENSSSLEVTMKKWDKELKKDFQYISQYVKDSHFVRFDKNDNIWKIFCYYENQKFGINIISQLIINNEKQPHLSPEILDKALVKLIELIIMMAGKLKIKKDY